MIDAAGMAVFAFENMEIDVLGAIFRSTAIGVPGRETGTGGREGGMGMAASSLILNNRQLPDAQVGSAMRIAGRVPGWL